MPLPSSGPLSISQIRNEIYFNGCGGSTYSLATLASLAGFPADPDRISEFYGYACNPGPVCNSASFCYSSTSCIAAFIPNQSCVCTDQVRYWVGGLGVNTVLYNACASSPVADGYYTYSGNCYTVSGGGGMITAVNALPNTIQLYGSSFSGCNLNGWASCTDACNNNYSPYEWSCVAYFGSFTIGTYLYPPNGCSFSGNQFYYYPGGWIQVSANTIVDIGSCPCGPAPVCHDYQATATSYMYYTDCCGNPQSQYLNVGDTFCAQVGTVYGNYIDLGTICYC